MDGRLVASGRFNRKSGVKEARDGVGMVGPEVSQETGGDSREVKSWRRIQT